MTSFTKSAEDIRNEIRALVRKYHTAQFGQGQTFTPGTSHLPYAERVFDSEEIENLVDASLDFWLTAGRFTKTFERELANYLGINHALFVNSGSSANLLALSALTSPLLKDRRLRRGDEVITVAAGFPTTVAPIIQLGAVPVFVDIALPTYNIDVNFLEQALSPRTRAVMIAHTLGNPFDLKSVLAFCEKHDLFLIEDNCDALGSLYCGKKTGTFGHIGTSSFYPAHHITTGEGGAVYTNDPLLKRALESLRDWGRDCWCPSGKDNTCRKRFEWELGDLPRGYDHKYIYSHFGFNLKATDLQAAIGVAQLKKLPTFAERRRQNWWYLRKALADLSDFFILPEPTEGAEPSWFGFALTLKDPRRLSRARIIQFLEARKIQTRMLFAGNLTRHPAFSDLKKVKGDSSDPGFRVIGDLPVTDKITADTFWVGVYPGLDTAKLEFITDSIRAASTEGTRNA